MDPVRRPATAAPAIMALDGLIIYEPFFVCRCIVCLVAGGLRREKAADTWRSLSLARPYDQMKLNAFYSLGFFVRNHFKIAFSKVSRVPLQILTENLEFVLGSP